MELILTSVVGFVVFGGLFLFLCPEWWSNSLGIIKEKKPTEKKSTGPGETQGPKANP
ncbi:hypothetical protein [Archangium sp.]|uniref:hypothetical protein n=1 Tax=Archangium sp. TaxID=1872627 RepID=UPI00286C71FD|nr:hypothetical protein [Archangium sp.]